MGKFVNNTDEFYKYCEENDVQFVDLRFTDIKGAWHHLTYRMSAFTREMIGNGIPFDGSSIDAWQPINKSDMILKADIPTASWIRSLQIRPLSFSVTFMTSIKMNSTKSVRVLSQKKR